MEKLTRTLFGLVLLCSAVPPLMPPTQAQSTPRVSDSDASTSVALRETHRGIAFGFLAKNGYYGSPEGLAQVDEIAAHGVKWVSLIVTVMQDTYYSTRVYKDYERTPSDAELEQIIDRFHARGIRVMLYPCVEIHDSVWRGKIDFPEGYEQISGVVTDYWTPWFKSYTEMYVDYARLAERKGVELLCLGAEMNGTVRKEKEWSRLIDEVRKVYRGPLIYEAHGITDFDKFPAWYGKLDMIGYSFYGAVSPRPGASVEEMVAFLRPRVEQMKRLSEKTGKPLLFTESGALARKGATVKPDNFRQAGTYDGEEQARFMEAVLTAFWNETWWRGFYWWKWDEQQNRPQYKTDPAGDQGFTIKGKPAAQTLKKWYARTDRP